MLSCEVAAAQVYINHRIPFVIGHVLEGAVTENAGIINQNVHPAEMIDRQPELEKFSAENGGQPPGLDNPLGARALYIFQDGEDTLYRLHGTPEFWTIGKAVSSGCVRLINQDIIDLYGRVSVPSPIVVRNGARSA